MPGAYLIHLITASPMFHHLHCLLYFSLQGVGAVAISLLILAKDVQLPPELRGFIFYAQVREETSINQYEITNLYFTEVLDDFYRSLAWYLVHSAILSALILRLVLVMLRNFIFI